MYTDFQETLTNNRHVWGLIGSLGIEDLQDSGDGFNGTSVQRGVNPPKAGGLLAYYGLTYLRTTNLLVWRSTYRPGSFEDKSSSTWADV